MQLYRYLTGKDDKAFCMRITKAINHGWQLYGSPTLTFNGVDVIAGQAITKEVAGDYTDEIDLSDL